MNINSDFDYLIKICILGDSGVGKTNLVIRFTENCFSLNIPPTIGYDYKSKKINIKDSNKEAKLQIWDTAGQERYLSLSKTIFQKVNGVILVYDITKKDSFDNIPKWIQIINEYNSTLPIILVGNKTDKIDERIITTEEGKQLADEYKMDFIESSSLNGENVEKIFIQFGNELVNYLKDKYKNKSDNFSIESSKSVPRKNKQKCCH